MADRLIRLTSELRNRADWQTLIPTASPFVAYGLIMALVALFAEG
jgi:hypothetical protein